MGYNPEYPKHQSGGWKGPFTPYQSNKSEVKQTNILVVSRKSGGGSGYPEPYDGKKKKSDHFSLDY